jgi:hypothetical protein
MSDAIVIFLVGVMGGFFLAALLVGQLVGWWARRNGASHVINHLEVTKS